MKRIAIFCDGTWSRKNAKYPTNVVLASQCVLPDGSDGEDQIVFYDEGVGTSKEKNDRLAGAFGYGLFEKIEAAYKFLVSNYVPGDEIFIFGFSRGAFTARSLAGLIRKCGIVSKSNTKDISEIFAFYKDTSTKPSSDAAQKFRMEHAPDTVLKELDRNWRKRHGADSELVDSLPLLNIKYVGVWDTVGGLGIPLHLVPSKLTKKYEFHDTDLSSIIHSARHAVAVDEQNLDFIPSLWENLDTLNRNAPKSNRYDQHWFPGNHGSVGGGGDVVGLSHNTLVWIIEGARDQGLGIDTTKLNKWRKSVNPHAPLRNESKRTGGFWGNIGRNIWSFFGEGARVGPKRVAELAESTLLRLEYEAKGKKATLYRPKTLKSIHKNVAIYKRPAKLTL